jgi:signal transduction histidine kinase
VPPDRELTLTDGATEGREPGQVERAALGEFLHLVLPLAVVFAVLQTAAGLWLRDTSMQVVALLIVLYGGCLFYAKTLFDRGRLRASVGWIAGGLVVPTLAGMLLQPSMLPLGALLPLTALAAALPFTTSRSMVPVLVGTVLWEIAVGVTAAVAPASHDPDPWYGDAFVVSTTASAAFVTVLLWMRYRGRLVLARDREHEVSERLREVDRLKTTLLRAASHDLRTPTAAILGAARTLEQVDDLRAEEARALIGSISRGATRLAGLLDDLLDAESLHVGSVELAAEPADLAQVVGDTLRGLELAGHRLIVDLEPAPASLDAPKVARVVENLVANALKHSEGPVTVWIRVRSGDEGAELVVEDDGSGIPAEERARVFEPFHRGVTAAPGTGLGLSIVAGFVDLHGGRVEVEDRPGGGASFRVTFPSVEVASASSGEDDSLAEDRTG